MNDWKKRLRFRLACGVEDARLRLFRPRLRHQFFIASAVHNAAPWVERHLESVNAQRYDPQRITHLLIDDASTDGTASVVEGWLARRRPAHAVEIVRNDDNRGGCANYTAAFRQAPASAIVLQLDGDDWLPDRRLLQYLNMVYHDANVWMTYNTWARPDGEPALYNRRLPDEVVAQNRVREHHWITSHLHSFRARLFAHVRDEDLRDPETGAYWKYAVDHAHYLPMLELAGRHAVHLARITYVYNLHPNSVLESKRDAQLDCEARIRALARYQPLTSLDRP